MASDQGAAEVVCLLAYSRTEQPADCPAAQERMNSPKLLHEQHTAALLVLHALMLRLRFEELDLPTSRLLCQSQSEKLPGRCSNSLEHPRFPHTLQHHSAE